MIMDWFLLFVFILGMLTVPLGMLLYFWLIVPSESKELPKLEELVDITVIKIPEELEPEVPEPEELEPATLQDLRRIEIEGIGPKYGDQALVTIEVEHKIIGSEDTYLSTRKFRFPENKLPDAFSQWINETALKLHNGDPANWIN